MPTPPGMKRKNPFDIQDLRALAEEVDRLKVRLDALIGDMESAKVRAKQAIYFDSTKEPGELLETVTGFVAKARAAFAMKEGDAIPELPESAADTRRKYKEDAANGKKGTGRKNRKKP